MQGEQIWSDAFVGNTKELDKMGETCSWQAVRKKKCRGCLVKIQMVKCEMMRLGSRVEKISLRRLTSPGSEGGENLGEWEGGSPGVLGLGGS